MTTHRKEIIKPSELVLEPFRKTLEEAASIPGAISASRMENIFQEELPGTRAYVTPGRINGFYDLVTREMQARLKDSYEFTQARQDLPRRFIDEETLREIGETARIRSCSYRLKEYRRKLIPV